MFLVQDHSHPVRILSEFGVTWPSSASSWPASEAAALRRHSALRSLELDDAFKMRCSEEEGKKESTLVL